MKNGLHISIRLASYSRRSYFLFSFSKPPFFLNKSFFVKKNNQRLDETIEFYKQPLKFKPFFAYNSSAFFRVHRRKNQKWPKFKEQSPHKQFALLEGKKYKKIKYIRLCRFHFERKL